DRRSELSGHAPTEARQALGGRIDERGRDDLTRPVAKARSELRHALVGNIGDEGWGRGTPLGGTSEPRIKRGHDGGSVRKDIGMVPFRGRNNGDGGPVRVEVAGV